MSAPPPPDPIFVLRGTQCAVTCVQFDAARSTVLYTGDAQGFVTTWNLTTRRATHKQAAHPKLSIAAIHCHRTSDVLITHGIGDSIAVWNAEETPWQLKGTLALKSLSFCGSRVYGTESGFFIIGPQGEDFALAIVDVDSGREEGLLVLQEKLGMPMCLSVIPHGDGSTLCALVGYEDGSVVLWDLQSHSTLSSLKLHKDPIMCLAYSPEKNFGVSGSAGDNLITWRVGNDSQLCQDSEVTVTNPGFASASIRQDGKLFVTGGWDGRVRVFGVKKTRALAVLSLHKQAVNCVAFSQDKLLVCGSKDGNISLWDIYQNA